MKSIILDNAQGRVLRETGELVVFTVMEPQPSRSGPSFSGPSHWYFHDPEGWWTCGDNTNRLWYPPSAVGERLNLVRPATIAFDSSTTSEYPLLHVADPTESQIVVATTASVEPVRIQDVSEGDMVAVAGKHPHYPQGSVGSGFGMRHCVFPEFWDSFHPKPEEKWDANPWCWKRVLKVEGRDDGS